MLSLFCQAISRVISEGGNGKFYKHEISPVLAIDIAGLKIRIFHSKRLSRENATAQSVDGVLSRVHGDVSDA